MSRDGSILKVFRDFFQEAKYLRHLQKETFDAIENLKISGNFSEDQLQSMRFSPLELDKLNEILDKPPCLVVMGQSTYGKLAIATRVFEKLIIPMIQMQNSALSSYCKPIRFSQVQSSSSQLNEKNQINSFKSVYRSIDALSLKDMEFSANALKGEILNNEIIDVEISHTLVKDGLQVLIFPTYPVEILAKESNLSKDKFDLFTLVNPIIVYAITKPYLTENETVELLNLKENFPELPILFIEIPPLPSVFSSNLSESEQQQVLNNMGILPPYSHIQEIFNKKISTSKQDKSYRISEKLMHTLCDKIGYLQPESPPQSLPKRIIDGELQIFSDFVNNIKYFSHVQKYFFLVLHGFLITAASILQQRHSKCMRMIILYAFDMAREIQITPKRINYSKEKESELFDTLMAITCEKQDEIRTVIMESLAEMKETIVDIVSNHKFKAIDFPSETSDASTREIRLCHREIQELLMNSLNESLGRQLSTRFDVMRESYLGTLQRCLENLENDCRVCGESSNIGDALKQMMHAAYHVEVTTSTSFIKTFWDKMKRLVTTMPGRPPPIIDSQWKVRAALEIITNLSESKLTKTICNQFRERIKANHDSFVVCMRQLESQLVYKLEEKEEKHLKIKKVDAPRLARVYLESTSLRDSILYGMPQLEKEIGRGQYGVVYGCKSWGGYEPCAIKSLVPLDDRHWNDLSMEFHYTKSIPEHDNIVSLRGSVIDYTYAQGDTPAVLLIMDRLNRDLHSGLKSGLDWITRIQISLDVTRGIRFLHSQGLVHRDIKLKNVLLDTNCRAKLTDLGFCKPEAMMSGSVVGTPIHMAPELFTGHYDNSVDVYAFGILFWYICSGNVKLPDVFEQCRTKDNLWSCVKKGGRPERLPIFSEECWILMSECWAALPTSRPFLGNVEPQLDQIMLEAKIQLLNEQKTILSDSCSMSN